MFNINDYNISEVNFSSFPKDKELVFIMYSEVYQYQNEFKINCYFKENVLENPEIYSFQMPLKTISCYPLGMIFKNKKISNVNKVLNTFDISINIKDDHKPNKIKRIPKLFNYLKSEIEDNINGYGYQHNKIGNQNISIFKDKKSGMYITIPHYELSRWYYLRSSSLTNRVLSGSLEGLYKSTEYLNEEKTEAKMIMKFGSSNSDAADIFRFVEDEYANIMFKNFSLDLSRSYHEEHFNKNTSFKSMNLFARFPTTGNLNLKVRGIRIDENNLFIYQILEEDSVFPFEDLLVYREKDRDNIKPVSRIKKKVTKKDGEISAVNGVSNSEFQDIEIKKENEYKLEEIRKDLENKRIEYKPPIDYHNDENFREKMEEVLGLDYDISFSSSSEKNDENIVKANISENMLESDENINRKSTRIEAFREMIFKLYEKDNRISFSISDDLLMPKKPFEIRKTRKKWKKAYLSDEVTPRKYIYALVEYENSQYCIIEVEAENDEKFSTLILQQEDNTQIKSNIIYTIMKDFVEYNKGWLFNINKDSFSKIEYLVHPKKFEENDIKEWAKRLFKYL